MTPKITPMMHQYLSIKKEYNEYLLFYRMGDFYELFFKDAELVAKELNIVLTKRGKHLDEDIPMCGIPFHSSDIYIHRLINKGYSVAICEQLETPEEAKKNNPKSKVIKREVVQIMTPGTITDDKLLNNKENNYLISFFKAEKIAIAVADITEGKFFTEVLDDITYKTELTRLLPKEIILPDFNFYDDNIKSFLDELNIAITKRPNSLFDYHRGLERLKDFFSVKFISGIANFTTEEIIAAGALLEYLEYTQKKSLPRLDPLFKISSSNYMEIDIKTRLSLEIINKDDNKNTLFSLLDMTLTSGGARKLLFYLSSPLVDPTIINQRLDYIEFFIKHDKIRGFIRTNLKNCPDIERTLRRIHRKLFKDFVNIKYGLRITLRICEFLDQPQFKRLVQKISNFDYVLMKLQQALNNDNTASPIQQGYNLRLDQLYELKNNTQTELDKLRDKYRNMTGINSLKIAKNNIIGYFIEITNVHANKINNQIFIHKQSLGTALRYTTTELQHLQNELFLCDQRIIEIENNIFDELCEIVLQHNHAIHSAASFITTIDYFTAMAEVAIKYHYTRPTVDRSNMFYIEGGFHPVVKQQITNFTTNNCNLKNDIWLITGPNMAGKSTFLRQNALIAILAQTGLFVPAKYAHIGIIDKLFTRIGASDNISQGQSTFMIEMLEK